MKDLVIINPDTGRSENHGVIAADRRIGKVPVWLTYDEESRFWWIIWKDEGDRLSKIGFVEARREVCWELYTQLDDEHSLTKLRTTSISDVSSSCC